MRPPRARVAQLAAIFICLCSVFALVQSFEIYGWGLEALGQLGGGTSLYQVKTPTPAVKTPFKNLEVEKIVAGRYATSFAITTDGTVFAFGSNNEGQLGVSLPSTTQNVLVPTAINPSMFNNKKVSIVSAGNRHAVGMTVDGSVFTWGTNEYGQLLTISTVAKREYPAQVPASTFGNKAITFVAAGDTEAYAVSAEGSVFYWGLQANSKKTGLPFEYTPADNFKGKRVTKIDASKHVLALTDDGNVFCWGLNNYRQCTADIAQSSVLAPYLIDSKHWQGRKIVMVSAGADFSLVLASDGTVFGFGNSANGLVGVGSVSTVMVPTMINPASFGGRSIVSVAGGSTHSVALASDGTVFAWGVANSGLLGITVNLMYVSTPYEVTSLKGKVITQIAAGKDYTLALEAVAKVTCFGVDSTDKSVCSSNGVCAAADTCKCNTGFSGSKCEVPVCFGASATEKTVCSGNGMCIGADTCTCKAGFAGAKCEIPTCFGVQATDKLVCSGNGACASSDTCSCNNGFSGTKCNIPVCFGRTSVQGACSLHGECVAPDTCKCNEGYAGSACDVPTCFGVPATDKTVCSSNGVCAASNTCKCNAGFSGSKCESHSCFGVVNSDSTVCSSNGVCTSLDTCKCNAGFSGSKCNIPVCFGTAATESSACSGHGACVNPDQCKCSSGYTGSKCDIPTCFGIASTDKAVCSSNGVCSAGDSCKCNPGYIGDKCETPTCFGLSAFDASVCSGNGVCAAPDTCKCNPKFTDAKCQTPVIQTFNCFGVLSNSSSTCSGNGVCTGTDTCKCNTGFGGPKCDAPICSGVLATDSKVCSSNGACVAPDTCKCKLGFTSSNCQAMECFGVDSKSSSACSSNGACVGPNTCKCSTGFTGPRCEFPMCFGVDSTSTNVCSGNGACVGVDTCNCNEGFSGTKCEVKKVSCFGVDSNDKSVCSSNGVCSATDTCKCNAGFGGPKCDTPICFGVDSKDANVCSAHGTCVAPNTCKCATGFVGSKCESFTCFGVAASDSSVCSSNGVCTSANTCKCNQGFGGSSCNTVVCYGLLATDPKVCGGNGICKSKDSCSCKDGFSGPQCSACSNGKTGLACNIDKSFTGINLAAYDHDDIPDDSVLEIIQVTIDKYQLQYDNAKGMVAEAERILLQMEEICNKKKNDLMSLDEEIALLKLIKDKVTALSQSQQKTQTLSLLNGLLEELQNLMLSTQAIKCDLESAKKQLVAAQNKLRELEAILEPYRRVIVAFNVLRSNADVCINHAPTLAVSFGTCTQSFTSLDTDFGSARSCYLK